MDTLQNLQRKLEGAEDIKSIVRTMKAMAASNIGQYEMAVSSLGDYYRVVALGIIAYFREEKFDAINAMKEPKKNNENVICAIVFGSDQGLVGQFNDSLAEFVSQSLHALPGKKEIWAVGDRIQLLLSDVGFANTEHFFVPNSVDAITSLVGQILIKSQDSLEKGNLKEFYIFHNQHKSGTGYEPVLQQFLPLDENWRNKLEEFHWPTKTTPQVAGGFKPTLSALIREYLFVTLFKACAESLACENSSRLAAMQRAEKNIDELLNDLSQNFNHLRQSTIDEELFDVISGFEAMKNERK
ncbi:MULTISPECIES: F0F1 ATP synthase subunit gamma [unclassified Flavobacterium]|jgi:F-type H+-transporting ATPase subunit gamma|uniref:F0F1 ATP synthase subunit gamma n=1 Tax=unclassified Flavobacterium TaxID=196869 RepID=UPI0025BE8823|nr:MULTISPECIES: F0F1 ATP synthase subunit gamma [unclassified Flavobacterium]